MSVCYHIVSIGSKAFVQDGWQILHTCIDHEPHVRVLPHLYLRHMRDFGSSVQSTVEAPELFSRTAIGTFPSSRQTCKQNKTSRVTEIGAGWQFTLGKRSPRKSTPWLPQPAAGLGPRPCTYNTEIWVWVSIWEGLVDSTRRPRGDGPFSSLYPSGCKYSCVGPYSYQPRRLLVQLERISTDQDGYQSCRHRSRDKASAQSRRPGRKSFNCIIYRTRCSTRERDWVRCFTYTNTRWWICSDRQNLGGCPGRAHFLVYLTTTTTLANLAQGPCPLLWYLFLGSSFCQLNSDSDRHATRYSGRWHLVHFRLHYWRYHCLHDLWCKQWFIWPTLVHHFWQHSRIHQVRTRDSLPSLSLP